MEQVVNMTITAVVDRFEGENVILLSEGIEISIPVHNVKKTYRHGEKVILTIDGNEPEESGNEFSKTDDSGW